MENQELQQSAQSGKTESKVIQVPADQLKQMISQLREYKDANADLLAMLNSSVEVIGFVKEKIFGGSLPKEMSVTTIMKLAARIPKVINNMDKETINLIGEHMDKIKDVAGRHLNESQIKQIAK